MKKKSLNSTELTLAEPLRISRYCCDDEFPVVAAPAGQGAVGFCGAVCGGLVPGAGVAPGEPGGAVPEGVVGVVPGLFGDGVPVESLGGIVSVAGTQGPLPGTGVGCGVT